jgi:hypothetical protein
MKTSNYLWAALATATLSLSACSSDENENGMQPKEKTAKLELTLVGAPADSRATGLYPPPKIPDQPPRGCNHRSNG